MTGRSEEIIEDSSWMAVIEDLVGWGKERAGILYDSTEKRYAITGVVAFRSLDNNCH